MQNRKKILYVVNVDWFFISHRLPIAIEAKKRNYDIYVATKLTKYKEKLIAQGFKVHDLKLNRKSENPLEIIYSLFNLLKIIYKVNPDIIHAITIKPILLSGLAGFLFKKIKFIYAISGLGFTFSSKGLKSEIRRFLILSFYRIILINKNFKIIFQNKSDMNQISKVTFLNSQNSFIINGSGINLKEFKPSEFNKNNFNVLLASRLLYSKGIKDFIDASKLVTGASFSIAGSFDLENKDCIPEDIFYKWIDDSNVKYLGDVKNMSQLINKNNIIVLPSFYGEGLPKILIEASACGRAIITTNNPGCRDAIENNITGILIPPQDANALAKAIQKLVNNPRLCKKMGRKGRLLAEKKYDINKIVEKHLYIYQ